MNLNRRSCVEQNPNSLKPFEAWNLITPNLEKNQFVARRKQWLYCKGSSEDACFCSKEKSVKTMGKNVSYSYRRIDRLWPYSGSFNVRTLSTTRRKFTCKLWLSLLVPPEVLVLMTFPYTDICMSCRRLGKMSLLWNGVSLLAV